MGFLFLILYPGPPPRPPPPPPSSSLSHTIFVNHLSHTFVHHHLCHNLSLFVKPSFTHHLFTHPSLSTTVFHTHLCQPSFTHHPSLSSHLSHTIFHTHLCQPSFTHVKASFTHHLSHLRFTWQAWQAWDPVASTFVLRGRRGTCRTGLALVARLGWDWSAYHFSWQAWLSVGIHRRFAWQARHLWHWAWHLWHWAGSGGALGLGIGRRDAAALCVAGVGLCRIHLRFAWQAWHFVS